MRNDAKSDVSGMIIDPRISISVVNRMVFVLRMQRVPCDIQ